MSAVDSRGGSTYRLLIICAREGRIVRWNGKLCFKLMAMRGRKPAHKFIEMVSRQIDCYNVLVDNDVIVPPTNDSPASLNEDVAYEFLSQC